MAETTVPAPLLPADVADQDPSRPWPVVLLTALGAWLAAVPLLGVVGLLLGDVISRSAGPYIIGVLLLAAAITVMRSRDLPIFVEQLAFPALLVGIGALAFGMYRDLPTRAASALLCVLTVGLASAIARTWLRALLGAGAASLMVAALMPRQSWQVGDAPLAALWLGLHGVLFAWAAAIYWERSEDDRRVLAFLGPFASGWVLATLAGLAWWSGMTFLLAGAMGGGMAGAVAREAASLLTSGGASWLMRGGSVATALCGLALIARSWPSLREARALAGGGVLLALCVFMPSLGGVLFVLAVMAALARWRMAAAAALAAVWVIGAFYYQLQWTLATKALVLVLAGAALAALAWTAQRRPQALTSPSAARAPLQVGSLLLSTVATLAVANYAIWQKEDLITRGEKVFVELAPVDPRSLMQGDYMRLNYRLPGTDLGPDFQRLGAGRPFVVVAQDARGVAKPLRIVAAPVPLGPDERLIELTPKDGRWLLVTDAWFFREGDAQRWQAAKYGEFRVLPDGRALLVGLADAQLRAIAP